MLKSLTLALRYLDEREVCCSNHEAEPEDPEVAVEANHEEEGSYHTHQSRQEHRH